MVTPGKQRPEAHRPPHHVTPGPDPILEPLHCTGCAQPISAVYVPGPAVQNMYQCPMCDAVVAVALPGTLIDWWAGHGAKPTRIGVLNPAPAIPSTSQVYSAFSPSKPYGSVRSHGQPRMPEVPAIEPRVLDTPMSPFVNYLRCTTCGHLWAEMKAPPLLPLPGPSRPINSRVWPSQGLRRGRRADAQPRLDVVFVPEDLDDGLPFRHHGIGARPVVDDRIGREHGHPARAAAPPLVGQSWPRNLSVFPAWVRRSSGAGRRRRAVGPGAVGAVALHARNQVSGTARADDRDDGQPALVIAGVPQGHRSYEKLSTIVVQGIGLGLTRLHCRNPWLREPPYRATRLGSPYLTGDRARRSRSG